MSDEHINTAPDRADAAERELRCIKHHLRGEIGRLYEALTVLTIEVAANQDHASAGRIIEHLTVVGGVLLDMEAVIGRLPKGGVGDG
jgi:hypothetical protein